MNSFFDNRWVLSQITGDLEVLLDRIEKCPVTHGFYESLNELYLNMIAGCENIDEGCINSLAELLTNYLTMGIAIEEMGKRGAIVDSSAKFEPLVRATELLWGAVEKQAVYIPLYYSPN